MSYRVLISINVDVVVAGKAYQYAILLFIAMFFHSQFDCYRVYLISTKEPHVVKKIVVSSLVCHISALILLVTVLKMKSKGVVFAMIISCFFNFAVTMVYTWCYSGHPTKNPFIFKLRNVLENEQVKSYMRIALPSAVLVCATWWAIEILLFMASKISVIAMSSMAVSVSLNSILSQVSLAMNISSTAVIGNALGEGDLLMAKTLGLVTFLEGTFVNALISILTYSQAGLIASLYTSDPDQLGTLTRCLQIMSLSIFLTSTKNCL